MVSRMCCGLPPAVHVSKSNTFVLPRRGVFCVLRQSMLMELAEPRARCSSIGGIAIAVASAAAAGRQANNVNAFHKLGGLDMHGFQKASSSKQMSCRKANEQTATIFECAFASLKGGRVLWDRPRFSEGPLSIPPHPRWISMDIH